MDEEITALLRDYRPSTEAVETLKAVPTVLVVGISGAGKNTVIHRLLERGGYHFIVTHTTRSPRPGEEDGASYHFINKPTSLQMLKEQKYIEANYYSQNVYGTSVQEFSDAKNEKSMAIGDIDVNGVAHFMQIAPQSVRPIFLVPPSYEVWLDRWRQRYGDAFADHQDDLMRRLQTAIDELEHALEASYYSFVVNDDLEKAVAEVDEIGRSGEQPEIERENGRRVTRELLRAMKNARI